MRDISEGLPDRSVADLDDRKWVDFYGDHWHADHRCDELGDTIWAVAESDRDACSVCVDGE